MSNKMMLWSEQASLPRRGQHQTFTCGGKKVEYMKMLPKGTFQPINLPEETIGNPTVINISRVALPKDGALFNEETVQRIFKTNTRIVLLIGGYNKGNIPTGFIPESIKGKVRFAEKWPDARTHIDAFLAEK
jgi:hypothetical protein